MNSASIPTIGADKELLEGINTVRSWLMTADGYTRIYITSNCKNLIKEFRSYKYPEKGGEVPIDKNNHLMDCLRYILHTRKTGDGNTGGKVSVEMY